MFFCVDPVINLIIIGSLVPLAVMNTADSGKWYLLPVFLDGTVESRVGY